MNIRRLYCSILALGFFLIGYSQSNFQSGFLPSINLNKKLENDWSFNFKIESRQTLKEGIIGDNNSVLYDYSLTDFSLILAKKVAFNQTIAAGYLIRLRDQKPTHRFIQQYVITKAYSGFRLSHRFVADETFDEREVMVFRLRYRISSLFPLNGQSIDPKEFYIKINHEYLNAFQSNNYDLEIRLTPFLGYIVNDDSKLEFGLDYRINSFLENQTSNRYWLSLNWFLSI